MKKNHKPTGRQLWQKYVELKSDQPNANALVVNIGADDPSFLEEPEAVKFASEIAKRKKFYTFVEAEEDIRLYGQNHLAERTFFFIK